MFLLYFRGRHILYLGDIHTPPVCLYAPIHSNAPCMFRHHPICCHAPLGICMFWGFLHVIWGSRPHTFVHSTCSDAPICLTSPHVCMPPCPPILLYVFRGISMWYGGYTSYVGVLGVSVHLSGILVSVSTFIVLSP